MKTGVEPMKLDGRGGGLIVLLAGVLAGAFGVLVYVLLFRSLACS